MKFCLNARGDAVEHWSHTDMGCPEWIQKKQTGVLCNLLWGILPELGDWTRWSWEVLSSLNDYVILWIGQKLCGAIFFQKNSLNKLDLGPQVLLDQNNSCYIPKGSIVQREESGFGTFFKPVCFSVSLIFFLHLIQVVLCISQVPC